MDRFATKKKTIGRRKVSRGPVCLAVLLLSLACLSPSGTDDDATVLLALLALSASTGGSAGDSVALENAYVHFIGNSITFVEDIPGRFHRIMQANKAYTGDYGSVAMDAPGGWDIAVHATGTSMTLPQILFRKGRYIVLQEQSCGTICWGTHARVPWFMALAAEIQAEPIFYQAWHNGGTDYITTINTLAGFTPSLPISMAPVDEVWTAIKAYEPGLILDPDNVHQNATGAAINAAVFYYTLQPDAPLADGILSQTGLTIE